MTFSKASRQDIYSQESWNIGMRRVNKIVEKEINAGFRAQDTGMYSHTADILVFKGNELVRVYESTNYSRPDEYVGKDRGQRYRDSLLNYPPPIERVFVCSHEENLRQLPGGRHYFEQHGIQVEVRGYQD